MCLAKYYSIWNVVNTSYMLAIDINTNYNELISLQSLIMYAVFATEKNWGGKIRRLLT